jgi:hypothetical protein
MAVLTLNRVVSGTTTAGGDAGSWSLNPITSLVASSAGGDTFANANDRRTFIIAKNTSGTNTISLGITVAKVLGTDDTGGQPLEGNESISSLQGPYWETSALTPGQIGCFGPYRPEMHNDSSGDVQVRVWDQTAVAFDNTDVLLGAFYLPWVDDEAGTITNTPLEGIAFGASGAALGTVQTILPEGVIPTWVDHDLQNNGYGWPLVLGRRRMLWIRNNSGSDTVSIVIAGGDREATNARFGLGSSESSGEYQGRWITYNIDDGEEFLWGPWDERFYDAGGSLFGVDMTGHVAIRAVGSGSSPAYTPGTTSGLDFAWLDLAL